ncbi:MAG: GGDEF domain-containing protein, partial [Alphaproteobacteria bacterium]
LVSVSQAIARCLEPGIDHVARFGGEEFLVVLAGHNADRAMTVAEAIRASVAALGLPNPGSPINGKVTISIGVATAPLDTPARPAWLMLKSDGALYAAKRRGRNCAMEHKDTTPAEFSENSIAS